jgi:hypothetical protein
MTAKAPGDHNRTLDQARVPAVAILAVFGAALAFAGVGAATRSLGGNPAGMVAGAAVLAAAGVCLLIPAARPIALLMTWNGLGMAVAMLVLGMFSIGALMAFPLALIAVGLSSWPRQEGDSIVSGPAIVVQLAGFLLPFVLYGVPENPGSWFSALT